MNVLVTGANGFVGSFLSAKLASKGFAVRAIVRKNIGQNSTDQKHILVGDISSFTDWTDHLQDVDIVIHLAARVHVMDEQSVNPLHEFLEVNLHGTVNLANQAAAAGIKRFVYLSSVKVNGEFSKNSPFKETDIPNPQDPYAVSKFAAEQALWKISAVTGMEVVIIRPPLVYGVGVKANFLKLLMLVHKSLPLPFGSIDNHRSMIYLENLVDAIITCTTHPNAANQLYLVSDSESISTLSLVHQLALALGKKCFVFPFSISVMRLLAGLLGKSAAVDRLTQSLVIDSSKIRQELDWQAPYTIQQGVQSTADWYKKIRKHYK